MEKTEGKTPEKEQPIESVDSSPTDEAKVEEKIVRKMSKCGILTNHNTRKDGTCIRYITCQMQGRTRDPRCIARGGVLR